MRKKGCGRSDAGACKADREEKVRMRYKQFQNAGVKVSELGIGTWAIGGVNFGRVDRQGAISA